MAILRIASAYRTVSVSTVLVIASTISMDLLAAERMEIYKAKSAENHMTYHFREDNGNETMKIEEGGSEIWRSELLRYTDAIESRKFRRYLHRMRKTASPYWKMGRN